MYLYVRLIYLCKRDVRLWTRSYAVIRVLLGMTMETRSCAIPFHSVCDLGARARNGEEHVLEIVAKLMSQCDDRSAKYSDVERRYPVVSSSKAVGGR